MKNFTKIVRIGKKELRTNRRYNVFCKIEYSDGRLSISGVEGPLHSGNAMGSCGQIDMHLKSIDIDPLAKGWTKTMLDKFLKVWDQWHLNDMHPECEHMRTLGWVPTKNVTVNTWLLKDHLYRYKKEIEKKSIEYLKSGQSVTLSENEQNVMNLPLEIKGDKLPDLYKDNYDLKKSEVKSTGWLYPEEHPDGLLTKECPICGYKYGTKWNKVEVPDDVLEFLKSLPNTDVKPAWI